MSSFARQMQRKPRRTVLLKEPPRPSREAPGDWTAYIAARERDKSNRKIHPIVRLCEKGIDWGVRPAPTDEVGWPMRPYDGRDCFRAAIATAVQVPIWKVPDLDLGGRQDRGEDLDSLSLSSWLRVAEWAALRGLEMLVWERGELPVPRRRWIGVVMSDRELFEESLGALGEAYAAAAANGFTDHCLVMDHDRLLFDPMCGVMPPPGMCHSEENPDEIAYGISFDRKES